MESQMSGQRLVSDSPGGHNTGRRGVKPGRSCFSFERSKEPSNNDKQNGHAALRTQQRQGNDTPLCFEVTFLQELTIDAGDQLIASLGNLRL